MTLTDDLLSEAAAIRILGGEIVDATDIGTYAIELAVNNWAVFPLRGKIPAIAGGQGVLDATTSVQQVAAWWGGRGIVNTCGSTVLGLGRFMAVVGGRVVRR